MDRRANDLEGLSAQELVAEIAHVMAGLGDGSITATEARARTREVNRVIATKEAELRTAKLASRLVGDG